MHDNRKCLQKTNISGIVHIYCCFNTKKYLLLPRAVAIVRKANTPKTLATTVTTVSLSPEVIAAGSSSVGLVTFGLLVGDSWSRLCCFLLRDAIGD